MAGFSGELIYLNGHSLIEYSFILTAEFSTTRELLMISS